MPGKMFYHRHEAAERLGVDEATIDQMIADGTFDGFRDGDKMLLKRDQVEAQAGQTATATAPSAAAVTPARVPMPVYSGKVQLRDEAGPVTHTGYLALSSNVADQRDAVGLYDASEGDPKELWFVWLSDLAELRQTGMLWWAGAVLERRAGEPIRVRGPLGKAGTLIEVSIRQQQTERDNGG